MYGGFWNIGIALKLIIGCCIDEITDYWFWKIGSYLFDRMRLCKKRHIENLNDLIFFCIEIRNIFRRFQWQNTDRMPDTHRKVLTVDSLHPVPPQNEKSHHKTDFQSLGITKGDCHFILYYRRACPIIKPHTMTTTGIYLTYSKTRIKKIGDNFISHISQTNELMMMLTLGWPCSDNRTTIWNIWRTRKIPIHNVLGIIQPRSTGSGHIDHWNSLISSGRNDKWEKFNYLHVIYILLTTFNSFIRKMPSYTKFSRESAYSTHSISYRVNNFPSLF